jgi:DNA polymerase
VAGTFDDSTPKHTLWHMDEQTKARLRLYLRSERAMGLNSVRAINDEPITSRHVHIDVQVNEARHEPEPPRVQTKSPVKVNPVALFGEDEKDVPVTGTLTPSSIVLDAPLLTTEEKRLKLLAMNETEVSVCTKCRLCETRTHTVFGEGDVDAKIFFIGEGPGETEDQTGRPFVGRAGELLNKMIAGMGLKREQVFIANIVKCRPPNNRVPAPDEVATCTPYLTRQLEIIRPRAIVTLGLPATQYMLETRLSMGRMRGQWHSWRGIKLMPTYHPAYVLRNPTVETRAAVWSDLKLVLAELGLPVPKKNI